MTIPSLDVRKNAIDHLPLIGSQQTSRLNSAISALPRQANDQIPTTHDVIEKQARELVGQTFFGTLLKQMHDSPFKSEIFSGGRGEQAFSPMYDSILSQRLTHGAGQKLVDSIVRRLDKAGAAAAYKKKEGSLVSTNRRA